MGNYLLCLSDDLAKDVDLYKDVANAWVIKLDQVKDLKDGDSLILYTHGQYTTAGGTARATNKIQWFDRMLSASDVCYRLIDADFPVGKRNLTVVVHACFSAGTVEAPPVLNDQTFAGQLCSALKSYFLPGLSVIGYQGQTKVGKGGFAAGETKNAPRSSRSQADPNSGELWQAAYGGSGGHDGDADGLYSTGSSVRWG